MRTINHIIMICGAALLLLAGCTSDLSLTGRSDEVPLRLSAAPTTGLTRAADGLYTQTSGFDGGEQVEVYVNSNSTHGTYQVNSTTPTQLDAVDGDLYYPTTGDVSLYAVYPSTSTASHTVKYDQTTDANYKASDLMYASKTVNQAEKTTTQTLSFGHQLVKLKVKIIKAADVTRVTKVEMQNVKRKVTVTPSTSSMTLSDAASATGETGTEANSDKILVFSGSNTSTSEQTYAVVFPVQEWSNADFITVTADDKTATYKLTKNDFTFGNEYTLTLNINAAALNNTISITNWTGSGTMTVEPTKEVDNAPAGAVAVDLGLSVKWANMNVGATSETGYGTYFAWGETSPKDYYDWTNYAWCQSSFTTLTKYCPTGKQSDYWFDKNATPVIAADNKTELDLGDDAARANWGGDWRMPTYTELNELFATYNTDANDNSKTHLWEWKENYNGSGHNGYLITCRANNNSIFLPAAGYRNGTSLRNQGSSGDYWSSTLHEDDPGNAWNTDFNSGYAYVLNDYRYLGFTVRPVREKEVSSATSSDIGKIICSNGHIHTNVSDVACGGTAVAIVAYVGNGEANSSYNRGLALSMADLTSAADTKWRSSGSGTDLTNQYSSLTSECLADLNGLSYTDVLIGKGASYPAAQKIAEYRSSCSVPSGCSSWFLPTIGQWSLILQGLTNSTTALSTGTNNDYKGGAINTILEGFAGTSARMKSDSGDFWSSTEYSDGNAWSMNFYFGRAYSGNKAGNDRVRAVLAF